MTVAEDLKNRVSRVVAGFLLLLCVAGVLSAREQVLVAGSGGEWTSRLLEALNAVEAGDYARGAQVLQRLLSSDEGGMVRMPVGAADLSQLKLRLSSDSRRPAPAPAVRPAPARPGQFARPSQFSSTRSEKEWGRYLNVSSAAEMVLRMLPAQGRAEYRKLYGQAAGRLLRQYEENGDPGIIRQVSRLYPLTEPGFFARELEADLAFEASRFDSAWVSYRAVLGDRIESEGSPDVLLRLIEKALACLKLAGADTLFEHEKERCGQLAQSAGEQTLQRYQALLKKFDGLQLQAGLPADAGRVPVSYWGGEIPGGSASPRFGAGGLPDQPGGPMEASWKSLDWASTVTVAADMDPLLNNSFFRGQMRQPQGIDYPFVPLVRRNSVFVSGVYSIYEIDGRPGVGKLLRQIEKPTPPSLRGRYREQSDSSIYTVTLWDRSREGGVDRFRGLDELPGEILLSHYIAGFSRRRHYMGYDITVSIPTRSLAAFDRGSGDLLWRTEDLRASVQKDIYGPNEIPAEISYSSPVVVRDGLVFAGGWKQDGYINSLVRALDLRTGKTAWEVPISSAQMEQTMFGELGREPFASFLLEEAGVLYYLSNLGAVAAIESRSGRVLWVTAYDYIKPPATVGRIPRMRHLYWGLNAPLLLGNVLVVAPRDSQYLLAIDTGRGPAGRGRAGEIRWVYDNSAGDLRDLLGVHQGKLYFSGPDGVFALDISSLDAAGDVTARPRAPRPLSNAAARKRLEALLGSGVTVAADNNSDRLSRLPSLSRIGSPLVWSTGSIAARGLLTSSGVIYASSGQLQAVDFELRKRNVLLPKEVAVRSGLSLGDMSGGIHIGAGQIIISSQRSLTAFSGPTF